mgnify:FL=1
MLIISEHDTVSNYLNVQTDAEDENVKEGPIIPTHTHTGGQKSMRTKKIFKFSFSFQMANELIQQNSRQTW